ncbi:RNA-guided endonuclease InsQ/TnpB family protein [Planococcus lenghuensis]|uniref:RNA-guided endonuclease InsQ/TnpB family protein n=1 Tax=Planococcus lenghuensis TaxID=2213202 RepID=UPI0018DB9159|nr:RNA-guided endonuclease TnpB family protein [Planococcus lenghuensis]
MATDKNGNHIKGTKKQLPDGWVTGAFHFAVFPTDEQKPRLERAFGCERKVYNEYVAGLYAHLESIGFSGGFLAYNVPNYTTITSRFDFLDRSNDSFVYNDAKIRFQAAIKKYNETYAKRPLQYKKSVRKKMKTGDMPSLQDVKGLPKFHSRKQGKFSYTTNQTNGNIRIGEKGGATFLRIPKFPEGLRLNLHRALPSDGIIKKATIKREGTRYIVSISVDYPFEKAPLKTHVAAAAVTALDYSQSDLYIDSEGRKAEYPCFHKLIEKRQRRLNKSLARKKTHAPLDENGQPVYSKNYQRTVTNYQKTMAKAANQRKDFLHKKSDQITNDYDAIVVEDLDLTNLAQCLKLGKKLHDNGFGMFRTMLKYKAERKGKHYIVADRFFPSSKLCSACGTKKENLRLSERTYTCAHCQAMIDRDHNAALNLKNYGIRTLSDLGFLADPVSS